MIRALRKVFRAYTCKICVCPGCGKRKRVKIDESLYCTKCRKKARPIRRTF